MQIGRVVAKCKLIMQKNEALNKNYYKKTQTQSAKIVTLS